jgi:hypothetical protein
MPNLLDIIREAWRLLERAGPIVFLPLVIGILAGSAITLSWDSHRVLVAEQESKSARQETHTAQTDFASAQRQAMELKTRLADLNEELDRLNISSKVALDAARANGEQQLASANADLKALQAKLAKYQKAEAEALATRARDAQRHSSTASVHAPPPDPLVKELSALRTVHANSVATLANGRYTVAGEPSLFAKSCTITLNDNSSNGAQQVQQVPLEQTGLFRIEGRAVTILYVSSYGSNYCNIQVTQVSAQSDAN